MPKRGSIGSITVALGTIDDAAAGLDVASDSGDTLVIETFQQPRGVSWRQHAHRTLDRLLDRMEALSDPF